jgi:phosphohistidine phosphatase
MLMLVQHGEAASKDIDPERPLTANGRQETERVARHLAGRGVGPNVIWHSGKLRARQTAELLAAALEPEDVLEIGGLAPLDDPVMVEGAIASDGREVMLVGHLPHLSQLTSLLLTGAPLPELVRFRMGGAVALEREEDGWRLLWIVTPDII